MTRKNPLPRSQRKHTPKAKTKGLYTRAIRQAFVKLDPRIAIKNPVMFLVWVGTIVTALVTINPSLSRSQSQLETSTRRQNQ